MTHGQRKLHTHAPLDDHGQFSCLRRTGVEVCLAGVATLTKGYDLDYIWRQVGRGLAKDAAGYYIRASENGESRRAAGGVPGARALGLEHGQIVQREPYDLVFGERKAPDGTQLGRPPGSGQNAADIYARLLAAERT